MLGFFETYCQQILQKCLCEKMLVRKMFVEKKEKLFTYFSMMEMALGFAHKKYQFTSFKFFSKMGMALGLDDKLLQFILSKFFSKM